MKFKLKTLLIFCCFFSITHAQTVTTIASQTGIDDDIILAPDGSIIGSNYEGGALRRLTLDGQASIIAQGFSAPNGLAYDSHGNLFMVDNTGNKIYKYEPESTPEVFVNITNPSGILKEWDSDTLIVTSYEGDRIVKVAPDGEIIEFAQHTDFNGPVGLCYDDGHNLYVANFNNPQLFRIDEDGTVSPFSTLNTTGYIGFIDYRDGYIYATLFLQAEIWKVDLEGNDEKWLGSQSGSMDGGPEEATFNRPNGILFSNSMDTLFISDFGTKSIRMITDIDGISSNDEDLQLVLNSRMNISPNPTSDQVNVSLNLPKSLKASLIITNSMGQIVQLLFHNDQLRKGKHQFSYALSDLPAGQYYLTLQFDDTERARLSAPLIIR